MRRQNESMLGMIIVTHGHLAEALHEGMVHVVGEQDAITTICIGADDDMDEKGQEVIDAAIAADQGAGVIIFTDMFGGTPSNLALQAMDKANAEVIAGANLPMLIKLAQVREEMKLKDAARAVRDAGRKYALIASEVLAGQET
jgi:PTS system mannose-specific IIA component